MATLRGVSQPLVSQPQGFYLAPTRTISLIETAPLIVYKKKSLKASFFHSLFKLIFLMSFYWLFLLYTIEERVINKPVRGYTGHPFDPWHFQLALTVLLVLCALHPLAMLR